MKQFSIENNRLTLRVKKGPVLVRYVILIFAILCILLPLLGIVGNAIGGGELKFQFFIFLGLSGLLSFYMFRIYLWNTFATEIIHFSETEVTYIADYKYFKDTQQINTIENLSLALIPVGYEEDEIGVLLIENNALSGDHKQIQCVTKMPQEQVKELITLITPHFDNTK